MECPHCGKHIKNPLAVAGGRKGKRVLSRERAQAMIAKRWASKRAREEEEERADAALQQDASKAV